MMVYKSDEERIGNLEEKIKKLEAQKKQLQAKTREKERKERTRRLIQIGAIMDSMGINEIEIAEQFKNHFLTNPKSKEWLEKFIASHKLKETQSNENNKAKDGLKD
jgi:GTP cyclohydrolase II